MIGTKVASMILNSQELTFYKVCMSHSKSAIEDTRNSLQQIGILPCYAMGITVCNVMLQAMRLLRVMIKLKTDFVRYVCSMMVTSEPSWMRCVLS